MDYEVDAKYSRCSDAFEIFKKRGFLIVRGLFEEGLIREILAFIKELNEREWRRDCGGMTAFLKKSIYWFANTTWSFLRSADNQLYPIGISTARSRASLGVFFFY